MKQWSPQRTECFQKKWLARNTANKLELQKKGAKQYKTMDSAKS